MVSVVRAMKEHYIAFLLIETHSPFAGPISTSVETTLQRSSSISCGSIQPWTKLPSQQLLLSIKPFAFLLLLLCRVLVTTLSTTLTILGITHNSVWEIDKTGLPKECELKTSTPPFSVNTDRIMEQVGALDSPMRGAYAPLAELWIALFDGDEIFNGNLQKYSKNDLNGSPHDTCRTLLGVNTHYQMLHITNSLAAGGVGTNMVHNF